MPAHGFLTAGFAPMTTIPEEALRARQRYIDGDPVNAIRVDTGFSLEKFYHWLDGAPQADGTTLLPPIPRRRIIARKAGRPATRVALVARLTRAAEMQMHGIEQALAQAGYDPGHGEDNARAMALLARTLRELTALDRRHDEDRRLNEPGKANDGPVPLDIDELRRSLSRKLEALVAEQQGTLPRVDNG